MAFNLSSSSALVLQTSMLLALLAAPGAGSAGGTWSVIAQQYRSGEVSFPRAIAVDSGGSVYVADQSGIQKRDAQGNWSAISSYVVYELAVDVSGNLYLPFGAGTGYNSGVLERDAHGSWFTVADVGRGPAQVYSPEAVAVDPAGSLYIADEPYIGSSNGRIQKRDAHGNWSVIATGGPGIGEVDYPAALAADSAGGLYVIDYGAVDASGTPNYRIQKRDTQGNWSIIAVHGPGPGQIEGFASALAVDAMGSLYVAEGYAPYQIQKRDAHGNWSVIAATGSTLGQVDRFPDVAVDSAGDLYMTDFGGDGRVQRRDAQGNWSLLAAAGADPGRVLSPSGLTVVADGSLWVADASHGAQIQKRDVRGNWSVIATRGSAPGQIAGSVSALAADSAGNIYAIDAETDCLWKRDTQGVWSVVASGGETPGQVEGVTAIAVDVFDSLYVADYPNGTGRLQKRDAHGNWSVIADDGGAPGHVTYATALAVDRAGNLYVAEKARRYCDFGCQTWGTHRIQKRDAQGHWSVIATEGAAPGEVFLPSALAVDVAGNVYVADSGRIQQRDAQGHWSEITAAGSVISQVDDPHGLALDSAGNLYVADTSDNRVLEYQPDAAP